jgi:hypothetical protein
MTEDQLQEAVIDLAHLLGLRVAHFRPARIGPPGRERWVTPVEADGKGFPDLVIAGGSEVIFPELKSDTGRLSPEQKLWQAALGSRFRVWRPADLQSGRIESELRAIRHRN